MRNSCNSYQYSDGGHEIGAGGADGPGALVVLEALGARADVADVVIFFSILLKSSLFPRDLYLSDQDYQNLVV